jgi:GNAT superfamily N-acetyltransferase
MVENPAGKPIAVLERSIRQDIPRLEGKRAGYVEGLCVVLEFRGHGIARELPGTSLNWARKNQCVAFATDRDRSSTGDSSKSMCLCAADAARRKIERVQGLLPHDMSTPPRRS